MIREFTSKTQKIGEVGEKIAVKFLVKHGFSIIERNFSTKYGEIDIVARKDKILYLIEVKTQNAKTSINSAENLTYKKLQSLEIMTQIYVEYKHWKGDYRLVACLIKLEPALKQALVQIVDLA